MSTLARALMLTLGAVLGAGTLATAQAPALLHADSLQPEWTVEPARAGRAQVVGYLHNSYIKDAANVWLRVDRLAGDGAVAASYRARVMGDVPPRGRTFFTVAVAEAAARYLVTVEAADWVDTNCR